MSKTLGPSFPFYVDDFLGGTMGMDAAEIGIYMLLLCEQWRAEHVTANFISRVFANRSSNRMLKDGLLSKFELGEDGNYRNQRMAQIRQERIAYIEKQSSKGRASAKSRWGNRGYNPVTTGVTSRLQPDPPSGCNSPSPSPYNTKKKEDDSDKRAAELPKELRLNPPTLDDVKNAAATIGVSADECEKFFYHYDKKGWIDNAGNPLTSLPSALASWKIKGAEIKAAAKPAPRSNPGTGQESHPPPQRQIWQIQADIDTLKKRKRDLNEKRRFEYPQNREKYAEDWQMHEKLKKQIEDLQKELSQ